MSLARMMSGVLAGLLRSIGCALGMTRNAPPVPLALSWQPDAAQVLTAVCPLAKRIGSCRLKIGNTQYWKYAKASRCVVCRGGFCKEVGLSNGLLPPPQLVSPKTTAAAATVPRTAA